MESGRRRQDYRFVNDGLAHWHKWRVRSGHGNRMENSNRSQTHVRCAQCLGCGRLLQCVRVRYWIMCPSSTTCCPFCEVSPWMQTIVIVFPTHDPIMSLLFDWRKLLHSHLNRTVHFDPERRTTIDEECVEFQCGCSHLVCVCVREIELQLIGGERLLCSITILIRA